MMSYLSSSINSRFIRFSVLVSLLLWSIDLEYFNWAILIFSYELEVLLNLIKLESSNVYISNGTSDYHKWKYMYTFKHGQSLPKL